MTTKESLRILEITGSLISIMKELQLEVDKLLKEAKSDSE